MSDDKKNESADSKAMLEVLSDERSRSTYHHSKTVVDQIQAMYESGETVLNITKMFGVSANYVHVTARRKGWQRPSWYKWKFRPAKKEDEVAAAKKKKGTKQEILVVERNDPSMLALFDQFNKQIDELNEQISALKEMCGSYDRLSMVKEVYAELEDKDIIYTETISSLQSEVRAAQRLSQSYANEMTALKEQVKLLKTQIKDLLWSEQKLSKDVEKGVKTIDTLKAKMRECGVDIPENR